MEPQQTLQTAVVIEESLGAYRVTAGGTTYRAETGVAVPLNRGDRVLLALGRGTARIVAILGESVQA